MKVKLSLRCIDLDRCADLIQHILTAKGVKSRLIKYSIVGNSKLEVLVSGSATDVERVKDVILSTYSTWRMRHTYSRKGIYVVNDIMRDIGKPFITDSLAEVLKLKGYECKLVGDKLLTNAPKEEVYNAAELIALALNNIVKIKPKAQTSAKKLISALAAYASLTDINELIGMLKELGYVREVDNYDIAVTKDWRSLLREVVERLRVLRGLGENAD